jgi:hypothetical protein
MPKTDSVPGYLVPAVAIAVGILGANSFADAAGFPPIVSGEQEPGHVMLRLVCAIVVGVLSAAVFATLLRLVRVLSIKLSETRGRPSTAVAITLIACGTVCLLGALAIPLYIHHASAASISLTMTNASVSLDQTSILSVLATIVTITAGAALTAIGIWGSLRADENVARIV